MIEGRDREREKKKRFLKSLLKHCPETFQMLISIYPAVAFFMTYSLANYLTHKSNSSLLLKNF